MFKKTKPRVTDAAKSEIHAYMTDAIMKAGRASITNENVPLRIHEDTEA